jgi:hypothetical protein
MVDSYDNELLTVDKRKHDCQPLSGTGRSRRLLAGEKQVAVRRPPTLLVVLGGVDSVCVLLQFAGERSRLLGRERDAVGVCGESL